MNRTDVFLKQISRREIDAALIENTENLRYLSGFFGDSSQALVSPETCLLFTDFRYIEQAEKEVESFEIIKTTGAERLSAIANAVSGLKVKNLGVEADISHRRFMEYNDRLKTQKYTDISPDVQALRAVKSKEEQTYIRAASKIVDRAFSHMIKTIRSGMSEKDVLAELVYFLYRHSEGLAFDPIVASGENGALPHARPTGRTIGPGDFLTMDFGCIINGYCSDFTRTIAIGNVDSTQKKVYDVVRKAQAAAIDAVRAGISARALDETARGMIAEAGYRECFEHGLGHGVGLNVHENPVINPASKDVLKAGMAITIEPGIYIKGCTGVRIEDLCIVQDDGADVLTESQKDLVII